MDSINSVTVLMMVGSFVAGMICIIYFNHVRDVTCCTKLNKVLYLGQKTLINFYRSLRTEERTPFVWWLYARSLGAHEPEPLRYHAPIYSLPYQAIDQGWPQGAIQESIFTYNSWIDDAIETWHLAKSDPEIYNAVVGRVTGQEIAGQLQDLPYMFFDFNLLYARSIEEKL